MKKLLAGLAALPFLAGVAMAGQPTQLTDTQMDKVTAGLNLPLVIVRTEILIIDNTIVLKPIKIEAPLLPSGLSISLSPT